MTTLISTVEQHNFVLQRELQEEVRIFIFQEKEGFYFFLLLLLLA